MTMYNVTPELPVEDVAEAQRFYRDKLGFDSLWLWENNFGAVGRDQIELFLYEKDGDIQPVSCYIFVDDADALYTELTANGVTVVDPLGSQPWGMREFSIEDCQRHVLRFGHGEKTIDQIEQFSTDSQGHQ